MPDPLRIFLRLLALVLFVASVVGAVLIVAVGPDEIARHMGKECHQGTHAHDDPSWCTWQDVLGIMGALPYTALVGAVLVLVLSPDAFGRKRRGGAAASAAGPTAQPAQGAQTAIGFTAATAVAGAAPMPGSLVAPSSSRHAGPRGVARKSLDLLTLIAGASVVLILVTMFVGTWIYKAGYTIHTTVEVSKKIRDAPRPNLAPRPAPKVAPAPRGLGRASLLRAGNFRDAMAEIRRAAPSGGRIAKLRVSADRIDAEVLAGGRAVSLRKPWNAKAAVVSTAAVMDGDLPIITFKELDARAPQRVTTAAARAAGGRPRDVDYLVLQDVVGLRWKAFLVNGKGQVDASPDGRRVG